MSLKIESLRCFATVARTGTLAEAANRLGRTQSAVSMALKQLEDTLGKRLFEGERKNRLSPLGAQVFELAQKQLRQFDDTVNTITTLAESAHGLLRIASVPSVAALVFPSVLAQTARAQPGLRIELRDTDTAQVIDALIDGRADIGLASGAHALNDVHCQPLFSDRFGLICHPDHALARQQAAPRIGEVLAARFLRNSLCDLIETPAFRSASQGAEITVHNTHSLLAMVRTGTWVTVLPETVARVMPEALAFRPIAGLPDRRRVSLLMREKTRFRAEAEALCAEITGHDWLAPAGPQAAP